VEFVNPDLRRRLRRLLAAAVVTIVAALALPHIAGRLLPADRLRTTLAAALKPLHAQLDFEDLSVHLLPAPHLALRDVSFVMPDQIIARAHRLRAYPRLLPLLRGSIELDRLGIDNAHVTLILPPAAAEAGSESALGAAAIREQLVESLRRFGDAASRVVPGLGVQFEDSDLLVQRDGLALVQLTDAGGRIALPPAHLTIAVSCSADLWDRLRLDAALDPEHFTGEARIVVTGADTLPLARRLGEPGNVVDSSRFDIDLRLSVDGPDVWHASLDATLPSATILRNNEEHTLGGGHLRLQAATTDGSTLLSLSGLDLTVPRATVSGSLRLDAREEGAVLALDGRQLDVAGVRASVLQLIGDVGAAHDIFDVLRGGEVTTIALRSRAPVVSDLFDLDKFALRGTLVNGRIVVSDLGLDIEAVNGEAHIARGVLRGKRASGRLGNSTASRGRLQVALAKNAAPFRLAFDAEANLADLPAVLARTVPERAFQEQLRRFQNVSGHARGRLRLAEVAKDFETDVRTNDFAAEFGYAPISDRIKVIGQGFSYRRTGIVAHGLQVSAAASEVKDASLDVDWAQEVTLDLQTGAGQLELRDIDTWARLLPAYQRGTVRPRAGVFRLEHFSLQGPLQDPTAWRLALRGHAAQAEMELPPPLGQTTLSADAVATEAAIQLLNATVDTHDARLQGAATFTNYVNGTMITDSTLGGSIGPRFVDACVHLLGLDDTLRVRRNWTVRGGRFEARPPQYRVAAALRDDFGLNAQIDIELGDAALTVHQLDLRDAHSNAAITAQLGTAERELTYRGQLDGRTLRTILAERDYLQGSLSGDFTLRQPTPNALDVRMEGKLTVEGLTLPITPVEPPVVGRLSLRADAADVDVQAARVRWGADEVDVHGEVHMRSDAIELDLHIETEAFSWDRVDRLLTRLQHLPVMRSKRASTPPLRGTVDIGIDSFSFGPLTWAPLRGRATFTGDAIALSVDDANLCGIQTLGQANLLRGGADVSITPAATDVQLENTLPCLLKRPAIMTGAFSLNGEIVSAGPYGEVIDALHGQLEVEAGAGRVYGLGMMAKIVSYLSLTEGFIGRLSEMSTAGMDYSSASAVTTIEDGRLVINQLILRAAGLTMLARGPIDLRTGMVELTVLASPLGAVDPILARIPIIGRLWSGPLISVPLEVSGPIDDPKVTPLSPSALTAQFVDIFRRTVRLPVDIIDPLVRSLSR
jgi:hypothetical protein